MSYIKMGIARGIDYKDLIPAFEAAVAGGFRHLEITMNTPEASKLITLAKGHFGDTASVGAGTVRSMRELDAALEAGASFIVSPVTNTEIISYCAKNDIPVYPGALTPTEILTAWDAGATMVKVFPVSAAGGAEYVRLLKGPFDHVKLLVCGGITPANVSEFAKSGIDGIAIGGGLFKKEWIDAKDFTKITDTAKLY